MKLTFPKGVLDLRAAKLQERERKKEWFLKILHIFLSSFISFILQSHLLILGMNAESHFMNAQTPNIKSTESDEVNNLLGEVVTWKLAQQCTPA